VPELLEAADWAEQYGLTSLDRQTVNLKDFCKKR
jgi:hypothetical protein